MKKFLTVAISCLLALMVAILSPLTVFAKAAENTDNKGKYISEVKVGMGKTEADAAAALDGYKILSDKNGPVDLNYGTGGGFASKGDKVVYLGYKTTDDSDDAVTDLAVMNMKGGYDVAEYDALFDKYIHEQIEPLITCLTAAIAEYRINFNSDNESNRLRAAYIRAALNKFIDDDTGKGLGDLLLNRTKYEMGDEAYEALSDEMKKNTADIVTILAQANGTATLSLENLIARAADTADDTWVDRFSATTYDDLIDEICDAEDVLPSDAKIRAARLYEDDARKIFSMWKDLYNLLINYEECADMIDTFDIVAAQERLEELDEFISGFDKNKNTQLELLKAMTEQLELSADLTKVMNAIKVAGTHDYLDRFEYGDGTLLDFFSRSPMDVELSELMPIAASLSDGQKAGLDFISLLELISIAITDGADYDVDSLADVEEASIYEGVDRAIYEKGGVALTTAARRSDPSLLAPDDRSLFSPLTITSMGVTGATFTGFIVSDICRRYYNSQITSIATRITATQDSMLLNPYYGRYVSRNYETGAYEYIGPDIATISQNEFGYVETVEIKNSVDNYNKLRTQEAVANSRAPMCKYLEIGFGVAMVLATIYTIYATYTDLVAYYNVQFTPIPHYMVDEKDITAFNDKGERIFIKNQRAYYKAVECNRTSSDEMYGMLGTCADLNGDVGKQWLALYAVKNPAMQPILADSMLAVVGYDGIPANYFSGIHIFGSDSAFNLNNPLYVWNGEAKSAYVYYNTDDSVKRSAAGSVFAGGTLVLAGGVGMIVGALAAFAVMFSLKRKKDDEGTAAA